MSSMSTDAGMGSPLYIITESWVSSLPRLISVEVLGDNSAEQSPEDVQSGPFTATIWSSSAGRGAGRRLTCGFDSICDPLYEKGPLGIFWISTTNTEFNRASLYQSF